MLVHLRPRSSKRQTPVTRSSHQAAADCGFTIVCTRQTSYKLLFLSLLNSFSFSIPAITTRPRATLLLIVFLVLLGLFLLVIITGAHRRVGVLVILILVGDIGDLVQRFLALHTKGKRVSAPIPLDVHAKRMEKRTEKDSPSSPPWRAFACPR